MPETVKRVRLKHLTRLFYYSRKNIPNDNAAVLSLRIIQTQDLSIGIICESRFVICSNSPLFIVPRLFASLIYSKSSL